MADEEPVGVAAEEPPDGGRVAEILVHGGLDLLVAAVKLGNQSDARDRNALVDLLDKVPRLCVQSAAALRASPCYAAVMFYERTRAYGAQLSGNGPKPKTRCFFNGLPTSLPMFGAPVVIQFPVERLRELVFNDMLLERMHTVSKLETFAENSANLRELADQFDHLPDLPEEVPMRVRIFVSRTRTLCEGVRTCKPASQFRQCAHEQCLRLFMTNTRPDEATTTESIDRGDRHEYWEAAAPMPQYPVDSCRFCSAECARQWRGQLDGLLLSTVDRPSTLPTQLHGVTLPSRAQCTPVLEFDRALQRNSQLHSAVGKLHKRRKKMAPAVARRDVDREVTARVVRANVDLGVLHATTKAAAVKRWHDRQRFPAGLWEWRDDGAVSLAQRARMLYDENPSDQPIHDMLKGHAFLRQCKQRTRYVLKIA